MVQVLQLVKDTHALHDLSPNRPLMVSMNLVYCFSFFFWFMKTIDFQLLVAYITSVKKVKMHLHFVIMHELSTHISNLSRV